QGTPAAQMPQVDGTNIKRRAAELRALGAKQVQRHLLAQNGAIHRILMESPRMGRTEQFTEVTLSSNQPEGEIVTAQITGITGQNLTA
ncbi:MAG: tRNA (N(6)-L-threonylcarbamoyladenosine(37)-C(2))-methylthiotransferase MtaB, partial [Paracoccaceae bacterium]|nr:tRNA (N(6)-L-threonylcarbamoyladenosine(37)-C(2))-methylthiotransferase MtaB [Paracoccaceae bacterium]